MDQQPKLTREKCAILPLGLREFMCVFFRLEQAFSDSLHRNFPTVNTRLTMSQGAIEAASYFISEKMLSDPHFSQLLKDAPANELANSNKTERLYLELVEELVNIAESPNM
jgi:hypothetical protein